MWETCFRDWRKVERFSEDPKDLGVGFVAELGAFRNCAACSGAQLRSAAGRSEAVTSPDAPGNVAEAGADSLGSAPPGARSNPPLGAQPGSGGAAVGASSSSQPPPPASSPEPPRAGVLNYIELSCYIIW